jgi:hypothetical protein
MSFNITTKSKSRETLVFPGPSRRGTASSSSYVRLTQVLKAANPGVSIAAVMDIVYESIFGMTAYELRAYLNLPGNVKLRRAIFERSPAAYRYLCFAEEMVVADLERNRCGGRLSLTDIMERLVKLSPMFVKQSRQSLFDHLEIDPATGQRMALERDDPPF